MAKALQVLISNERRERYEVVSIDDFLKMSPTETIYEEDVFEISNDLCKSVLGLLETGNSAVTDRAITSERIWNN